jgi:hypothetical protein
MQKGEPDRGLYLESITFPAHQIYLFVSSESVGSMNVSPLKDVVMVVPFLLLLYNFFSKRKVNLIDD